MEQLLLPIDAESRSLNSILYRYCNPIIVGDRPFWDADVRLLVMRLSRIVRLWRFCKGGWAINAAYLLDAAEPLECLSAESLPVLKMHVLVLAYEGEYKAAHAELEQARTDYPTDNQLAQMQAWLWELQPESEKKERKHGKSSRN